MTRQTVVRVFVTAVGGDLGQSIVKALRCAEFPLEIVGGDIQSSHAGEAFVENCHQLPEAGASEYVEKLSELAESRVDVVIPASEPEIARLSKLSTPARLPNGIPILCQSHEWSSVHGDKLRSMQALEHHVSLAPFADASDHDAVARLVASVGFPIVVKPRRSSGARNIRVVNSESEMERVLADQETAVAQAWLDDDRGEYSVAVHGRGEELVLLAFRRSLGSSGCSWYAETSDSQAVLKYATEVAIATGLQGSSNIQIRHTNAGPRLLEINPRYSSLVAARAAAGFRDVEWDLQQALGLPQLPLPTRFQKLRFQRFFHELIDIGAGYHAPAPWAPRAHL